MAAPTITGPRERILDAAKQVFGARGFRGGSLSDVAVLAGLTRAGVLHHFPSKESMLLALLAHRDEVLEAGEPAVVGPTSIFDLVHQLEHLIPSILDDPILIRLAHVLAAESADPAHPARAWVRDRHELLRRRFADAIRFSIGRGEMSPDVDPESLAIVLLAAYEGAEVQWLVDDGVSPVAAAVTLSRLVDGLRLR